ncbi:MAG TPA: NAD(P)-binding domain-containing protein [Tepidisphaeraceae bacterium]|nr:NAD(P)-binding domain-containing protein [Tepidisphaeraceae bacterium]
MERTDVIVIGAGPIGLELAVALKRRGIDYLQFDARQVGYTISWFAPQTKFFSSNERVAIAGVPLQTPDQNKATREEYLAYLRTVVRMFDLDVRAYEAVTGIDRVAGEFIVQTRARGGDRRYRAPKIVLCTGGTDRPRKLNVPGEDLPHVSHYFRDPHEYFGTDVLIVGGKNSAVEAALRCHHAGARVAMSYRRDQLPEKSIKYWLLPEINNLFETGKVPNHFPTQPVAITPSHVTLRKLPHGDTFDVPADFVLIQIGYEQDNTLFKLAGVQLLGDCGAPAYDDQTMETNVPGLYVAGTAVGGTQDKYRVFIENCHVHVERIVAALTGAAPPAAPAPLARPES